MFDKQTLDQVGLSVSNWDKFNSWKDERNKDYEQKNSESFKHAVPDPKERKQIYEQELRLQGIKAGLTLNSKKIFQSNSI